MAVGGTGPRRRAREIALQILVKMDVNPELEAARAVRLYFDHLAPSGDIDADDDDARASDGARGYGSNGGTAFGSATSAFANAASASLAFDKQFLDELVSGVADRRQELDQIVQDLSRNWRLERMALVERNVIRVALYEMKFMTSTPTNVALNEAVELAKRYGTTEGAAFVNGLLDRAATELHIRR